MKKQPTAFQALVTTIVLGAMRSFIGGPVGDVLDVLITLGLILSVVLYVRQRKSITRVPTPNE